MPLELRAPRHTPEHDPAELEPGAGEPTRRLSRALEEQRSDS